MRDPFTGSRRPPLCTIRGRQDAAHAHRGAARSRATAHLDLNDGLEDVVTERSDVTGRDRALGRRDRRAASAGQAPCRTGSSTATSSRLEWSSTSGPPSRIPGFDVVSENRFFSDRDGVEWEELSFSVNGTKWGADRPPFPLLQPEKVLAPPLDLALDAAYRYRLEGHGDGGRRGLLGRSLRPADDASARSIAGTVWIDRDTFRRVKLQAVQTGLSAPVVSNEETVRFAKAGASRSAATSSCRSKRPPTRSC